MENNSTFRLINAESSELAFSITPTTTSARFKTLTRESCYTIIWIQDGEGIYKSDFSTYRFSSNDMLFFTPYQPFVIQPAGDLAIQVIAFHPDFFCLEKHNKEVACNGVLFNNIYMPPSISVPQKSVTEFSRVIELMTEEIRKKNIAQRDLLISYLKIFLIRASRLKVEQQPGIIENTHDTKDIPNAVSLFKHHVEENYKIHHKPSHYAEQLCLSAKSLSQLCKLHLHKTASQVIHERLMIEAKRELYLTDKTVREIAFLLGFNDEYYFSRFFKKSARISPQGYRKRVGFNRKETLHMEMNFCPL